MTDPTKQPLPDTSPLAAALDAPLGGPVQPPPPAAGTPARTLADNTKEWESLVGAARLGRCMGKTNVIANLTAILEGAAEIDRLKAQSTPVADDAGAAGADPIEMTINTRDEHGMKQPLDPDAAEALGQAARAIHDKYTIEQLRQRLAASEAALAAAEGEAKAAREEVRRLHCIAVWDPDKTADEVRALGQTVEAARAMDVWNRRAALRQRNEQLKEMRAERETLRVALEWYADEGNYQVQIVGTNLTTPAEVDAGARARAACAATAPVAADGAGRGWRRRGILLPNGELSPETHSCRRDAQTEWAVWPNNGAGRVVRVTVLADDAGAEGAPGPSWRDLYEAAEAARAAAEEALKWYADKGNYNDGIPTGQQPIIWDNGARARAALAAPAGGAAGRDGEGRAE